MSVERLLAIERGDVDALPAPVYLRGFVQSYAIEVGLDPDELSKRYLAQFEQFEGPSALDQFASELDVADDWESTNQDGHPGRPVEDAAPAAPWRRAELLPVPLRDSMKATQADDGHIVMTSTERMDRAREFQSRPAAMQPTNSKLRLKPLLVAAILAGVAGYFLSNNLDDLRGTNTRAEATDAATPPSVAPESATAAPSADAARADRRDDASAADARNEAVVAATRDTSPVEDVDGHWTLTNRVESSAYEPFNNLMLVYQIQLQQDGSRVTGTGHKWSENGRTLSSRSRTPISFEGTLNGRRLELKFSERGRRRTSGGVMVMDVSEDGSLRGTFTSDAAQSSGSSQAKRAP